MKKILIVSFSVLVLVLVLAFGFKDGSEVQSEKTRTVKHLHETVRKDVRDLITYKAMPTKSVAIDQLDPFLFLNHHGPQTYPENNNGLPFGPHPHKGFETVTFILDGSLVHSDNSGHRSEITAGGVQWMTAGKGIVHSEMSSEEFQKNGGSVEMLQLWVNLPAKKKNIDPGYRGLQSDEITHQSLDGGVANLHLISGTLAGAKGPIDSETGVVMSWLDFEENGSVEFSVDPSREVFLYVVNGSVEINGTVAAKRTLVEFSKDGSKIGITAQSAATVLFGHADPTGDKVVAQGPFVMNSREEINKARKDYRAGKFGSPIEED